jgi:hypothetical protein
MDETQNVYLLEYFVRTPGGGFYGVDGIYTCGYTLSTTKKVVHMPAVLTCQGLTGCEEGDLSVAGSVLCPPPLQDPADTEDVRMRLSVVRIHTVHPDTHRCARAHTIIGTFSFSHPPPHPPPLVSSARTNRRPLKATWNATVEIYEAGGAIPGVNAGGAEVTAKPTVHFASECPHISSIAGADADGLISYTLGDLSANNKVTIAFKLTDRDTASDDMKVAGKASNKFVTAIAFGEPDGEAHTVVLTLNPDFEDDKEATITLTATDEHDRAVSRSFKIAIKPIYSAFWATLASDDDVTAAEGERGCDSSKSDHTVGGADRKVKWKITDNVNDGTFNVGNHLDLDKGIYTVPTDGLYMVAANIRIDGASGQFKMHINIQTDVESDAGTIAAADTGTSHKAVTDLQSSMPGSYTTLKVGATFNLKKGDELTVKVFEWGCNKFRVQYETGWGVALVEGEAFGKTPQGCMWRPIQTYNSNSGYELYGKQVETWDVEKKGSLYGTWHSHGFNANTAKYTVQETGIYRVNMQLRADSQNCQRRLMLVVNEDTNYVRQGCTFFETKPSHDADTMSVGCSVYLEKGWRTQMGMYFQEGTPIMDWSTFSIVKVGPADTPGFHGVLDSWITGGVWCSFLVAKTFVLLEALFICTVLPHASSIF